MTLSDIRAIYDQPFFDLIQRGRNAYLEHWSNNEVQLCTLLSIKISVSTPLDKVEKWLVVDSSDVGESHGR